MINKKIKTRKSIRIKKEINNLIEKYHYEKNRYDENIHNINENIIETQKLIKKAYTNLAKGDSKAPEEILILINKSKELKGCLNKMKIEDIQKLDDLENRINQLRDEIEELKILENKYLELKNKLLNGSEDEKDILKQLKNIENKIK